MFSPVPVDECQDTPQLLPSISFSIQCSLIIIPFAASKLLAVPLNKNRQINNTAMQNLYLASCVMTIRYEALALTM
jgi:hypothetical protein